MTTLSRKREALDSWFSQFKWILDYLPNEFTETMCIQANLRTFRILDDRNPLLLLLTWPCSVQYVHRDLCMNSVHVTWLPLRLAIQRTCVYMCKAWSFPSAVQLWNQPSWGLERNTILGDSVPCLSHLELHLKWVFAFLSYPVSDNLSSLGS